LNEEFGFYINRPFYIVSELPFNRVAHMHRLGYVWHKRWTKLYALQEQWWFDETTKTVRNNKWKNFCLAIRNKGTSNDLMTVSSITSRWW
jgi:hypothetical protein